VDDEIEAEADGAAFDGGAVEAVGAGPGEDDGIAVGGLVKLLLGLPLIPI